MGAKRQRDAAYAAYISSPQWRAVRERAFARYGRACQKCGQVERLDVHHVTYERFTREQVEDLRILCRDCHNEVHALVARDKVSISRATKTFLGEAKRRKKPPRRKRRPSPASERKARLQQRRERKEALAQKAATPDFPAWHRQQVNPGRRCINPACKELAVRGELYCSGRCQALVEGR